MIVKGVKTLVEQPIIISSFVICFYEALLLLLLLLFCFLQGQTYAEIKDLKPNSMYFLQVQTISHYGGGKLRSEKAAIFYNTTKIHGKNGRTLSYLGAVAQN